MMWSIIHSKKVQLHCTIILLAHGINASYLRLIIQISGVLNSPFYSASSYMVGNFSREKFHFSSES